MREVATTRSLVRRASEERMTDGRFGATDRRTTGLVAQIAVGIGAPLTPAPRGHADLVRRASRARGRWFGGRFEAEWVVSIRRQRRSGSASAAGCGELGADHGATVLRRVLTSSAFSPHWIRALGLAVVAPGNWRRPATRHEPAAQPLARASTTGSASLSRKLPGRAANSRWQQAHILSPCRAWRRGRARSARVHDHRSTQRSAHRAHLPPETPDIRPSSWRRR